MFRPLNEYVLARVDGIKRFHNISKYPVLCLILDLVMFRWDAPLFRQC
jgi:hypothetical protein